MNEHDDDLVERIKDAKRQIVLLRDVAARHAGALKDARRDVHAWERKLDALLSELTTPTPMPLFDGDRSDDSAAQAGAEGSSALRRQEAASVPAARPDGDGVDRVPSGREGPEERRGEARHGAADDRPEGQPGEGAVLPAGQPAGTVGHGIGSGAGPMHGIDAIDRPMSAPPLPGVDGPRRADTFDECEEVARAIVLDIIDEHDRRKREWTTLVANGGTDREILDALREAFDADEFVSGTLNGRTYTFHGSPPALWVGWHLSIDGDELPAPTLRTEELVRHVRAWLAIPQAGAAKIVAEEPGHGVFIVEPIEVRCRQCGAEPGQPCIAGKGKPPGYVHAVREERAVNEGNRRSSDAANAAKRARKGKAVAR